MILELKDRNTFCTKCSRPTDENCLSCPEFSPPASFKPAVKRGNVYKIAYSINRAGAKRHLIRSFQSGNQSAAIAYFINYMENNRENPDFKFRTFELLTGNWKLICKYENTGGNADESNNICTEEENKRG